MACERLGYFLLGFTMSCFFVVVFLSKQILENTKKKSNPNSIIKRQHFQYCSDWGMYCDWEQMGAETLMVVKKLVDVILVLEKSLRDST